MARGGIVALQSAVRGRRGREEVAARWLALGRRFSKHKAATMIQVCLDVTANFVCWCRLALDTAAITEEMGCFWFGLERFGMFDPIGVGTRGGLMWC